MPTWLVDSMELSDLLDIILVSFILYQTLLLLRGTRAVQSLAGLLILVVLFELSGLIGMSSMAWLLDKFFVYIVLAVVILFQDDIRQGLARAGGRFFHRTGQQSTDTATLEEMVKTAFALASRRMGALIVIERDGSLVRYIEQAFTIDARLSQELLMSMFHPTSPLHDGAIVVRNERVVAAKVFLPLSLSPHVSRFLGTRHRAAIGLTEQTDAIVLIVSEERGTVSVAHNGVLDPVSDMNELRQKLQETLAAPPEVDTPLAEAEV